MAGLWRCTDIDVNLAILDVERPGLGSTQTIADRALPREGLRTLAAVNRSA